jgi:C-terminal processing protease CtpA/Prc
MMTDPDQLCQKQGAVSKVRQFKSRRFENRSLQKAFSLTAMASTYTVTVNRNSAGFGLTPFKYALVDCERKKKSMNFKELLVNCAHAPEGGLPVQAVDSTGAAAAAGIQAWDVITHINGQDVRKMPGKEIIALIKTSGGSGSVQITFLRSATPAAAPVVKPVGSFRLADLFRNK